MSIFSRIKFHTQEPPPEPKFKPCIFLLCDGSGLREVESPWFGGLHFVKCECKKQGSEADTNNSLTKPK